MARWNARRVVGLAALLAVCVIGAWAVTNALGCGFGERAIFAQFPNYGKRTLEPRSDIEGAMCFATFYAADPQREVYAYYERELRERGWRVEIQKPPPWSTEPTTLEAKQGHNRYAVIYEPDVRLFGGRRVRVFVTGWGPPPG